MSGNTSREHFKTFLQLDVDDFVEKPFSEADILIVAARAMKTRALREALLGISRLCFRAYVSFQKLESLGQFPDLATESATERARLEQCMADMKAMTTQLLASERAIKVGKGTRD